MAPVAIFGPESGPKARLGRRRRRLMAIRGRHIGDEISRFICRARGEVHYHVADGTCPIEQVPKLARPHGRRCRPVERAADFRQLGALHAVGLVRKSLRFGADGMEPIEAVSRDPGRVAQRCYAQLADLVHERRVEAVGQRVEGTLGVVGPEEVGTEQVRADPTQSARPDRDVYQAGGSLPPRDGPGRRMGTRSHGQGAGDQGRTGKAGAGPGDPAMCGPISLGPSARRPRPAAPGVGRRRPGEVSSTYSGCHRLGS